MKPNIFRESSVSHLARMGGFALAIIVFLFFVVMIFNEGLLKAFLMWVDPAVTAEAGTHFVHGATFMTMIWILTLAMLVQVYRPTRRVAAMQIALVIAALAFLGNLLGGTFDVGLLVFFLPVLVAAALHPAREELLRSDAITERTASPALLVLVGLSLVPVGLYAAGQLNMQLTLADEHVEPGHYQATASYVLAFLTVAVLAAIGGTGRRGAAYAAGVMAVVLAGASLFQPVASAIDPTWSVLAVLWGLALVVVFELSDPGSKPNRDEATVQEPRPSR